MAYIKSYLILFVVLSLLTAMVQGERMKHYIRFFSGVIMAAGILGSVLALYQDSDSLAGQIAYESFTGQLEELQRDTRKVEFVQNEFFIREYEEAISEDICQIAENVAEQYGYQVKESTVSLQADYTVEQISVTLEEKLQNAAWRADMAEKIKEMIAGYYSVDTTVIQVEEGGK
jgi:stage III sporulation protein AF